jgi:hypothetical protein
MNRFSREGYNVVVAIHGQGADHEKLLFLSSLKNVSFKKEER